MECVRYELGLASEFGGLISRSATLVRGEGIIKRYYRYPGRQKGAIK